jgi:hypothetical protein
MVTAESTYSASHRTWFMAAAGGMALGVLVSLVGAALGLSAPRVDCDGHAPTQLILGLWLTVVGGCLQIVPLGVALSARRRWRTTLALGGGLLLLGLLAIVGIVWLPSLQGVIYREPAVAVVPGLTGIALGLWLRARRTAPPALSALETNAFCAAAIVLFVASWYAAIGVSFAHFCLTF